MLSQHVRQAGLFLWYLNRGRWWWGWGCSSRTSGGRRRRSSDSTRTRRGRGNCATPSGRGRRHRCTFLRSGSTRRLGNLHEINKILKFTLIATVEPPNKGHVGDNINSAVLSFIEKLSSFRGYQCTKTTRACNFGISNSVLCYNREDRTVSLFGGRVHYRRFHSISMEWVHNSYPCLVTCDC